jgi:glycosyltransferase involved in cell wall biosynthesis
MRIIFLSHEASLTGAPLVLMNFLRWIKNHKTTWQADVVFLKGGSRFDDFSRNSSSCKVFSQNPYKRNLRQRLIYNLKSRFSFGYLPPRNMLEEIVANDYDLIYCNSISTLTLGLEIKEKTNKKLVLHIHELDIIIKLFSPSFDEMVKNVDSFVAVSKSVSETLTKVYQVPTNKISVINEFIYPNQKSFVQVYSEKTNRRTIGASGYAHWRKGPIFFLLVAQRIIKLLPEMQFDFQWVGACKGDERIILENVAAKLGIVNHVTFVGETNKPDKYYNNFDLFLMTSLEDPFPIVCIEMGTKGIPIICFEGAGGSEEWLPKEAVVPYLDVNAMATAAVERIKNEELYDKESLAVKKASETFIAEVQCPRLAEILERL